MVHPDKHRILTPKSGDDYINWVTFSQNSFVAQPGVWNTVTMTINMPSYAALGYYYAVLFKPSLTTGGVSKTEQFKSSNAVLVLLNALSPNEHASLKVNSFTSVHTIYEYLPATFKINVFNNGNIYLPPTGNVFISSSSSFNKIIDTLNINPDQGNVLPGTSRLFTTQWVDGFPVFVPKTVGGQPVLNKQGQNIDQLKWNFGQAHKFRFGKYYAKMVLVYNNGSADVPITAVVSFWVIPWKLILLILFIIALMIGAIYLIIHQSRKLKKQTKWRA